MATIKMTVADPYMYLPGDLVDVGGVSYEVVDVDIGTHELRLQRRFWANHPWLAVGFVAALLVAMCAFVSLTGRF